MILRKLKIFLIYEAKNWVLTSLEEVLSGEKNVRNFSETHRVLILELVAGHRYHSSRYRCGNWSQTGCY